MHQLATLFWGSLFLAGTALHGCAGNSEQSTGSGGTGAPGPLGGNAGLGGSTNTGAASPVGGATIGGNNGFGGFVGDVTGCVEASDCGWGEIDHEILQATDCICLFGCPYLPLNQQTVARRLQQYQNLCNPQVDGRGNPCPVDECMQPPPATCVDGMCGPIDPFGG